jgi:hypothetical protein
MLLKRRLLLAPGARPTPDDWGKENAMTTSQQQTTLRQGKAASRIRGRRKTLSAAKIEKELRSCLPKLQPTAREMYPYQLLTGYGILWISPCEGAIRTRFDVIPEVAPAGTSLNPYSGKWNFEGLDSIADLGSALFWIGRIAI